MRRFYVSTGILQNAIKFDGEGQLEVLAFCVQAKRIYINSIIYNPSIRNLMKVFRLGYGRLTKTLNKCIADGWAHYDDKSGVLIFHPITEKGLYKINIDFEDRFYTLTEIKDILRELCLANNVKLQQDANHRYNAKAGKNSAGTGKRKRIRSISNHKGFSVTKISKMLGVCKSKAMVIRDKAVKNGMLNKCRNVIETDLNIDCDMRSANIWYKESGNIGYLFRGKGGRIMCQLQNIYAVNNDNVKLRYVIK